MVAEASAHAFPSEVRLAVVIPGIGGSVLANARREIVWSGRLSGIAQTLLRPEGLAVDEPLTPVGVIESTALFPGFSIIHGYRDFVQEIAGVWGWDIDWGDPAEPNPEARVVVFPYDFRQRIEESAAKLGELIETRLDRLGLRGQRNRVLVIAHSMGGLVARRWVADGNWDVCRAVVTLGTPHRGAPKALKFLVDGAPWWTGRSRLVRDVLRSWPSMYALLPRYAAITDLREPTGSDRDDRQRPDLYPADIPWSWLQKPAAEAYAMHREIEAAWKEHHLDSDCLALRGVGHATLLQSRWDGAALTTVEEQLPAHRELSDELGDGTVPAISAIPIEQGHRLASVPPLAVRHSRLVTAKPALALVRSLLLTAQPDNHWVAGDTLMIGLELDDAFVEHESIVIGAYFEPADLAEDLALECRLYRDGTEVQPPPLIRDTSRPWRWTARLAGLPRGEYRIKVRALATRPQPLPASAIEEFFVVARCPEEPAGNAAFMGLRYDADLAPTGEPFSDAELLQACQGIRAKQLTTTPDLVERIVATQAQLRRSWDSSRTSAPPVEQQQTLWLLGWLYYESSWELTQDVKASFESPEELEPASQAAVELIIRLATSYLRLPWPHWAPRGLGTLRSRALAESKRDTPFGYSQAWLWHGEAKKRYVSYSSTVPAEPARLRLGLDETMLQLALAETGTACRTVERALGLWGQEESGPPPTRPSDFAHLDETGEQRGMFDQLVEGSQFGRDALEKAAEIERMHGLVHGVDEERMAQVTAFQNPGIMTARACLLVLPLCGGLERDGLRPPDQFQDWAAARAFFLDTFRSAYRATEAEVPDGRGGFEPLASRFQRPLVHLRLAFGLLMPGAVLPSRLDFADCLAQDRMDDQAVEALSAWLAGKRQSRRGEGNPLASAMMPGYIRLVEEHRMARGSAEDGYRAWRERWFQLDRYATDPGRREWLAAAIAASRGPIR
ncbi:MAG: hypothetical protein QOE23_688 [Pseudonocardiales bacterium]|nr:hypothetical protein [Pseudonocardiales bacterium]